MSRRKSSRRPSHKKIQFLNRREMVSLMNKRYEDSMKTQEAFWDTITDKDLINDKKTACHFDKWLHLGPVMGEGSFGRARQVCIPKKHCRHYAVLKETKFADKLTEAAFLVESYVLWFMIMLQRLQKRPKIYPHFVGIYFSKDCSSSGKKVGFQILERGATSLEKFFQTTDKRLSNVWWRTFFMQMMIIFEDLNELMINHNDLHIGNVILIHPENPALMQVKLIDFGGVSTGNQQLKDFFKTNPLIVKTQAEGMPTYFFKHAPKRWTKNRDIGLFFEDMADSVENQDIAHITPKAHKFIYHMDSLKSPTPEKMYELIKEYF